VCDRPDQPAGVGLLAAAVSARLFSFNFYVARVQRTLNAVHCNFVSVPEVDPGVTYVNIIFQHFLGEAE
jgi:hypothetical protein